MTEKILWMLGFVLGVVIAIVAFATWLILPPLAKDNGDGYARITDPQRRRFSGKK